MPSIRQLFLDHVGQTSPKPLAFEIERAEGIYLYDKSGKEYIDLIAGVSVANLGHSNKYVVQAIKNQIDKYMHTMVYGEMIQSPQVDFATLLSKQLPESLNSVYFVNSGSEATEVAMKLAKRATNRTEIIACKSAYHGSTQGALSIMGGEFFKQSFRPLLPDISFIEFNNFEDIEKITSKTACLIMEVVQGEAGVIIPKDNYLQKVKARCENTGTLLIFDEIQTGFGRTGSLFAFQKYGVVPDMFTIAKAMGAGLPIGGLVADKNILNLFTHNPVLGHITTFGGNPVSASAAFAGLTFLLENENLIQEVEKKENLFRELLQENQNVKEIRSSGLLIAVELGSSDKLFNIIEKFVENGIISDWFLFNDTSFRISPPITISYKEIQLSFEKINECLNQI